MLNLTFVGRTRTNHRLLDLPGGVFGNTHLCCHAGHYRRAASLTQQQSGFRVDVHEGLLDRRLIGLVLINMSLFFLLQTRMSPAGAAGLLALLNVVVSGAIRLALN